MLLCVGFVMCGCFDKCVGVFGYVCTGIYCVCVVCTVFLYCFVCVCLFLFVTSVRTTATEVKTQMQ